MGSKENLSSCSTHFHHRNVAPLSHYLTILVYFCLQSFGVLACTFFASSSTSEACCIVRIVLLRLDFSSFSRSSYWWRLKPKYVITIHFFRFFISDHFCPCHLQCHIDSVWAWCAQILHQCDFATKWRHDYHKFTTLTGQHCKPLFIQIQLKQTRIYLITFMLLAAPASIVMHLAEQERDSHSAWPNHVASAQKGTTTTSHLITSSSTLYIIS